MPLTGPQDAIGRVSEPDAAVRFDHHIVGRVEPMPAPRIHQGPYGTRLLDLNAPVPVRTLDDLTVQSGGAAISETHFWNRPGSAVRR